MEQRDGVRVPTPHEWRDVVPNGSAVWAALLQAVDMLGVCS